MFKVKTKEERIKDILRCVRESEKPIQCYPWEYDRWCRPGVYEEGYEDSERQPHPKDIENCWSLPKMWIPPSDWDRISLLISLFTDLPSRYEIIHNDPKLYNLVGSIHGILVSYSGFCQFRREDPPEHLVKRLMDQYILVLTLCLGDPKSDNYKRIYKKLTLWVRDEKPEEPDTNSLVPPYVKNPDFLEIPSRWWDPDRVWI